MSAGFYPGSRITSPGSMIRDFIFRLFYQTPEALTRHGNIYPDSRHWDCIAMAFRHSGRPRRDRSSSIFRLEAFSAITRQSLRE
jgi:hypothetical protein